MTDRLVIATIQANPVLDPAQGLVDLGDQLALAVAGAQFQGPVGLRRGAIGDIRMILGVFLEVGQGLTRFAQDIVLPVQELLSEVFQLPLIHERFVLCRTIDAVFDQNCGRLHRRPHAHKPAPRGERAAYNRNRTRFNGACGGHRLRPVYAGRGRIQARAASILASSTTARVSIWSSRACRAGSSVPPRSSRTAEARRCRVCGDGSPSMRASLT